MSIGNRKDEGSKGTNFTWQSKVLKGLQRIVESNGSGGDVLNPGTIGTTTSVASNTSVQTLAGANSSRKSIKITNDGSETLYVREGTGATTSLYTWKLLPNEMAVIDDYTGIITGIWNVISGNAVITETT